jgi:hypothetical protein
MNCAAAQHGIAVDRCAREIVGILQASPGALAATECQPVRRCCEQPALVKDRVFSTHFIKGQL